MRYSPTHSKITIERAIKGRSVAGPRRVVFTVAALCCLGLAASSQTPLAGEPASGDAQSRATAHTGASTGPAAPAPPKPVKAYRPRPVAGLSQAQMDNAYQIVRVGRALRLPKRAYVIAVATAMQESRLLNLASDVIPESKRYPNQGSGSDHDSVGLFQQRPSAGWGPVRDLMRPDYAARRFYLALRAVQGWQRMALSNAAQAVQGSAFPQAYAKHERLAQQVVDSIK